MFFFLSRFQDRIRQPAIPSEGLAGIGIGGQTQMSDLTSKIHELHATLEKLRKESEDQVLSTAMVTT